MRKRLLSLIISMILVVACFAPTVNAEPTGGVDGFVERLYTIALNRLSDTEGKAYWIKQLKNKDMTGAEVAHGFFFSEEFAEERTTNEEYVTRLYRTFMNREPEDEGFAYWVGGLSDKSLSRESVFIGFVDSAEWVEICDNYKIVAGGRSSYLDFLNILYQAALGREPDEAGANYWLDLLRNKKISGADVAREFFFSPEFVSMDVDNEGFVTKCYSLFLNREPDADGLNYWKGLLDGGKQRSDLFDGFAYSDEYWDLCKNYGIKAAFDRPAPVTAPTTVDVDQSAKDHGYEIIDIDMGNGETLRIYGYYIDMSGLDSLVNDYREQNGLPRLPESTLWTEKMKLRAAECTVLFSHIRPNGKGGEEANLTGASTSQQAYDNFFNSPGHRAWWTEPGVSAIYSIGFRRMIYDEVTDSWSGGGYAVVQTFDFEE